MTNAYESATVPGIYFAGTIMQGVAGLKKYGIPANSGAVHGHRYNARAARRRRRDASLRACRARAAGGGPGRRRRLSCSSRGHARHRSCGTRSRTSRARCRATPTARSVTRASSRSPSTSTRPDPDGVAITVETDAAGDIHPAVYVRRRGRVDVDATLEHEPAARLPHGRASDQLRALIDGVLRWVLTPPSRPGPRLSWPDMDFRIATQARDRYGFADVAVLDRRRRHRRRSRAGASALAAAWRPLDAKRACPDRGGRRRHRADPRARLIAPWPSSDAGGRGRRRDRSREALAAARRPPRQADGVDAA